MRGPAARIPFLFAAAVSIGTPGASVAQVVKLTRIGGAVELGTEMSHQETESAGGPTRVFDRYRFLEEVELGVDGFVLSNQFVNFGLGGSFGLRQELFGGTGDSENSNATLLGYDGSISLFPTKLLSLFLFGSRFEDEQVQSFGTNTDSLNESIGGKLRINTPWFPSTISVEQRHLRSTSSDGFVLGRREDTRRFVEYDGRHSSEALQLNLSGRAEDVDDNSIPRVGDYRVYDTDGAVSYRWGPYFEKFWRLSGGYFERRGRFDFSNAFGSSAFYWDPTDSLSTSLEQRFDLSQSAGQDTDTLMSVFTLSHQLWESLRTNFNVTVERTDQDAGTRASYGSNLSLDYEKKLSSDSVLLIDIGVRYRFEDREFEEDQTINTGENLAVSGFTGNFLSNRNVDPASVRVFESRGGPLLIEGFDYLIDVVGDRTSIDPIFGGGISVGDAVFVDYVYLADSSAEISRPGFRVGLGWDAGWISLRYEHDQDKEHLVAGEDQPLQHSVRDSVRIDLSREWGTWRASTSASFLEDDSGDSPYREFAFGQDVTWQPRAGLFLSAILRETQRNFRNPSRGMRIITAGTSALWQFWGNSTVRVFADFRDLHNSASLDQRDAGLGLRARLRFGKIEVTPVFLWNRRQRGQSVSDDLRGLLRLRRSF